MFIKQCPICASEIDIYTKDWRACYQELPDTPVQSLPLPSAETPDQPELVVHDACWQVAWSHRRIRQLMMPQLRRFKQCMLDLAPLQPSLASMESPEAPTGPKQQGSVPDSPSSPLPASPPPAWGTLECLPWEVRYAVLETLTDGDVESFVHATGARFPRFLRRNHTL